MLELIYANFQVIKMKYQVGKNDYFRRLLLFAFNQDSKASKGYDDICTVHGENLIARKTDHVRSSKIYQI